MKIRSHADARGRNRRSRRADRVRIVEQAFEQPAGLRPRRTPTAVPPARASRRVAATTTADNSAARATATTARAGRASSKGPRRPSVNRLPIHSELLEARCIRRRQLRSVNLKEKWQNIARNGSRFTPVTPLQEAAPQPDNRPPLLRRPVLPHCVAGVGGVGRRRARPGCGRRPCTPVSATTIPAVPAPAASTPFAGASQGVSGAAAPTAPAAAPTVSSAPPVVVSGSS